MMLTTQGPRAARPVELVDLVHAGELKAFEKAISCGQAAVLLVDPLVEFILSHDKPNFLDVLVKKHPGLLTSINPHNQKTIVHMAASQGSLDVDLEPTRRQGEATGRRDIVGRNRTAYCCKHEQPDSHSAFVEQWCERRHSRHLGAHGRRRGRRPGTWLARQRDSTNASLSETI
jgi:hypothetical protein